MRSRGFREKRKGYQPKNLRSERGVVDSPSNPSIVPLKYFNLHIHKGGGATREGEKWEWISDQTPWKDRKENIILDRHNHVGENIISGIRKERDGNRAGFIVHPGNELGEKPGKGGH